MALTNLLVNEILVQYFGGTLYAALHVSDPTNAGLASTELSPVSIPTYSRQAVTWSTPANRSVTNANPVQWVGLPAVSCGFIGIWDAVTNGNMLAVMACREALQITTAGSSIYVPIGSIAVVIGGSPVASISLPAAPANGIPNAPITPATPSSTNLVQQQPA